MAESLQAIQTSAIVVSRNAASSLRACILALEKSAGRERIEIIVVDSGSTDGSAQIDAEFPTVTVMRLPRNFGLTKARNIGARTATGEYLLYLAPEVEVEPGTIQTLAAKLSELRELAAAAPLLVDEAGQPAIHELKLPRYEDVLSLWKSCGTTTGKPLDIQEGEIPVESVEDYAVMVRRQFMKGMNYLDERYGESWSGTELFYQIRRAGRKAAVIPAARAVLHTRETPALDPGARAALASDHASGAARYIGKHFGVAPAIRFRLAALAYAAGKLLTFTDMRYHASLLSGLLTSRRIDGSQS